MNFENLGFSFETSGFEVNPTFLSGSEAQGMYSIKYTYTIDANIIKYSDSSASLLGRKHVSVTYDQVIHLNEHLMA